MVDEPQTLVSVKRLRESCAEKIVLGGRCILLMDGLCQRKELCFSSKTVYPDSIPETGGVKWFIYQKQLLLPTKKGGWVKPQPP
jgi:hypothetical protein